MKSLFPLFVAASMTAAPVVQAQDGTATFSPVGDWTVDYGDDYCQLIRTFSDGKRAFGLALERLEPGTAVRMMVVGEVVRPYDGTDAIGYAFGPGGSSGKARYVHSATATGESFISLGPIMLVDTLSRDAAATYDRAAEEERARGITGFTLSEGLVSPVRVETGSLGEPVRALQACADDLLAAWGLDAARHRTMTAPAILNPNPHGVIPRGTLSYTDLQKLGGGVNQVRLMVGADGTVTGCEIRAASLPSSRNERICKLATERASFDPARDSAGQAMASVWTGSPLDLGPGGPVHTAANGPASSSLGPAWGLAPPPYAGPPLSGIAR